MKRAPHRHEEPLIELAARLLSAAIPGVPQEVIALACRQVIPEVLDRASEVGAVRSGVVLSGKVTEVTRDD